MNCFGEGHGILICHAEGHTVVVSEILQAPVQVGCLFISYSIVLPHILYIHALVMATLHHSQTKTQRLQPSNGKTWKKRQDGF